jgi:hypothetical protein
LKRKPFFKAFTLKNADSDKQFTACDKGRINMDKKYVSFSDKKYYKDRINAQTCGHYYGWQQAIFEEEEHIT